MIYTNLLRSFKSIPSHLQTKNKEELALIVPSFMDEAVIGEDRRERELCGHTIQAVLGVRGYSWCHCCFQRTVLEFEATVGKVRAGLKACLSKANCLSKA